MACQGKVLIIEDNCCFCNTAAFTLATENKNVDLFFVSFRNGLYEVPFVVLADHETRSIVITIRGSCSLVDLVTDLCLGLRCNGYASKWPLNWMPLNGAFQLFAPGKLLYIAEDESLENGVSSQWIDPK
ncbi:hypothetical protein COOONC_01656 [Cooperia oncophora]